MKQLIKEMQQIDRELFSKKIMPSCVWMECRNKVRFVFKSNIPYVDSNKPRILYTCKKHKEDCKDSVLIKDLKVV